MMLPCWLPPHGQEHDKASVIYGLERSTEMDECCCMSTVKQIESALEQLPLADLQAVRDWLDDFIEEQLEVSDEFKAKIQRANQEIAAGVYSRVRKAEAGD
jgi:hypothetical protein